MNKSRVNHMFGLVLLSLIILTLSLNACTSAVDPTLLESPPEDIPVETVLTLPETIASSSKTPPGSPLEDIPVETVQTLPEETSTSSPTPTVDPAILIAAATLFEADFESGVDIRIRGSLHEWEIRQGDDDNLIYCNFTDDDGTDILFGSADWSDYAVELDVQFINNNSDNGFEILIRYGEGGAGYRATIYNNWAAMGFWPGENDFGGGGVSVEDGEWHTLRVEVVKENIRYFVDDELIIAFDDDLRASGEAGIALTPGTEVCVDNLRLWAIDENGPIAREIVLETTDPDDPRAKYEGGCEFCFVNGNEPDMPIWNIEGLGYTHQPGDPREQIVLDETFSIDAGEEVVFEDKIIWVKPQRRGDIDVYGTLIVRNSLLLWDQTEHNQTNLHIKNGGTLIIESSYMFWADQFMVNWAYEDGSTILLDNFVGNPWTSIQGSVNYTAVNFSTVRLTFLADTHDTHVDVSDAHHLWFEIFPPVGEHMFTFPAKLEWVDWEMSDIWPNTTVTVNDSYLYERDISLSYGTHITVQDVPSGFGLGWSIGSEAGIFDCELRGLGDPDQDMGVFYEHMVWEMPCNDSSLTVKNSVFQRAWPFVWGNVRLRIYDSNLVDPTNDGYGGIMEIYNSTMDRVPAYKGGKVYLENSRIRDYIEVKDANSVIYGYNISPRDSDRQFEIIEVDGGRYIELENPGPPWD